MNLNQIKPQKNSVPSELEKNILDCQPGHWERLAEDITLEGREDRLNEGKTGMEGKDGSITIPKGREINVLGAQEYFGGGIREGGRIQIKVAQTQKEQAFYVWVSPESLKDKKIKVQSGHR
ncbi:MAG: hypothetical protein AAB899_01145 [Patescibacteria group bacterium]